MTDPYTQETQEDLDEFTKSGFVTTHLAIDAVIKGSRDAIVPAEYTSLRLVLDKIHKAIDDFNVEVWLKWLYSYQAFESHSFLEANAANVNMLVGGSAGRVMITLRWRDAEEETKHHYVSLLGADKLTLMGEDYGYKPAIVHGLCGFQGVGMNGERAVELLTEACRVSKDLRNNIRPSTEISFG